MSTTYQHKRLVADNEQAFGAYGPSLAQSVLLKLVAIPPFHRGTFRRKSANLVRSLSNDGMIDIRRNNASYRLGRGANLIEDALLVYAQYNRLELDFLRDGTPEGGTFVDLGANVGLYSLPLAHKVGPSGRVLAVDANSDIVDALAFNANASGFDHVDIACVAVGEKDKQVRLEIRKNDHAIVETHEDPDGDIKMMPLMDIVAQHNISSIDALKADIEGYEDRALIPFLKAATSDLIPGRIVIEHAAGDEWQDDLAAFLVEFGYELVRKERSNSLYRYRAGGDA